MSTVNAIIRQVGPSDCRVILVYEDGSRTELPAVMSLDVAVQVQKLFRRR